MKRRIVNILPGGGGRLKGLITRVHRVVECKIKSEEMGNVNKTLLQMLVDCVASRPRHCEPACQRGNPVTDVANSRGLLCCFAPCHDKCAAFTMAEILLSLTIIGVVAAITLPSLTGNINERTWNTQRKALYSRISQAISLMPSLNGYGTVTEATSSTNAVDTAAETFITSGLSKVLKINNICDSEHLADCGVPDKYINHSGAVITPFPETLTSWFTLFNGSYSYIDNDGNSKVTSFSIIDTKVAAFETANGETLVTYYNPVCKGNMNEISWLAQEKMCVNFLYDLNGKKGPNTVGKDIGFMTVFYPTDSIVVSVRPLKSGTGGSTPSDAIKYCKKIDDEGVMPNIYELASISLNRINVRPLPLSGCASYASGDRKYISGSLKLLAIGECSGSVYAYDANTQNGVHTYCVKR